MMKIKLIFENSGDELTFDPVNSEVAEYYIDCLDRDNSNYFLSYPSMGEHIFKIINKLRNSTQVANDILKPISNISLPEYSDTEYLNQNNLNFLHALWAAIQYDSYDVQKSRNSVDLRVKAIAEQLHHMLPDEFYVISLGDVITKLGLMETYNSVNMSLHDLESIFSDIRFKTPSWYSVDNHFSKSILTNNICNLRLTFNHLGRTLYNKYTNFDNRLEHKDENSYNQLLGFVSVHLVKPQTIDLSKEYIEWCKLNNVIPTGDFLNIGNLPDIDIRINEYRNLIYRNLRMNNSMKLTRG